jgi:hypothetical protein
LATLGCTAPTFRINSKSRLAPSTPSDRPTLPSRRDRALASDEWSSDRFAALLSLGLLYRVLPRFAQENADYSTPDPRIKTSTKTSYLKAATPTSGYPTPQPTERRLGRVPRDTGPCVKIDRFGDLGVPRNREYFKASMPPAPPTELPCLPAAIDRRHRLPTHLQSRRSDRI